MPTMATSAWPPRPAWSRRGRRAKVPSPAYRGTWVASTGPIVAPVMIRGTGSVMFSVPSGRPVDRLQFPLAGADRGLFGGQGGGTRQDKVNQAGHDEPDQPRVVHAVRQVGGEVAGVVQAADRRQDHEGDLGGETDGVRGQAAPGPGAVDAVGAEDVGDRVVA